MNVQNRFKRGGSGFPVVRTAIPAVLLFLLAGCSIIQPSGEIEPDLTVHVLDVGQGLAVLACDGQGGELLYDTGPKDAAERILSCLDSLNVDTIETVVLSHPDADHAGGLFGIAGEIHIQRVVWANFWPERKGNRRIDSLLEAFEIPQQSIRVGDTLGGYMHAKITCLWPQEGPFLEAGDSTNANSVVIRISAGETHCLLPGDVSAEAESVLVARWDGSVNADLLLASHHGSKNSNSLQWLGAVQPQIVIVSCARNNSYGHPAQEALDRFSAAAALVRRTDLEGTVVYRTRGIAWVKE